MEKRLTDRDAVWGQTCAGPRKHVSVLGGDAGYCYRYFSNLLFITFYWKISPVFKRYPYIRVDVKYCSMFFFTARRYAKRDICCRRVSVVSVRYTPVFYQNS